MRWNRVAVLHEMDRQCIWEIELQGFFNTMVKIYVTYHKINSVFFHMFRVVHPSLQYNFRLCSLPPKETLYTLAVFSITTYLNPYHQLQVNTNLLSVFEPLFVTSLMIGGSLLVKHHSADTLVWSSTFCLHKWHPPSWKIRNLEPILDILL